MLFINPLTQALREMHGRIYSQRNIFVLLPQQNETVESEYLHCLQPPDVCYNL